MCFLKTKKILVVEYEPSVESRCRSRDFSAATKKRWGHPRRPTFPWRPSTASRWTVTRRMPCLRLSRDLHLITHLPDSWTEDLTLISRQFSNFQKQTKKLSQELNKCLSPPTDRRLRDEPGAGLSRVTKSSRNQPPHSTLMLFSCLIRLCVKSNSDMMSA